MLDFSVSGLCRRHGLGSVTQVCFGISVLNFMCMSFLAVGKSLTIFSYIAFKMVALWFWAMFNGNPPIAPCYPLLWVGGILVDHWLQFLVFNRTKAKNHNRDTLYVAYPIVSIPCLLMSCRLKEPGLLQEQWWPISQNIPSLAFEEFTLPFTVSKLCEMIR